MDTQQAQYQQAPSMAMPIPPSNDATIASMRWQSDSIVNDIYRIFGGLEVKQKENGDIAYYKPDGTPPPVMNQEGLTSTIGLVKTLVNPTVSLTNFSDIEANELIRQTLHTHINDLARNASRFGINKHDLNMIHTEIKILVVAQLKRAVGGHEANNFHTQTVEQNVHQQHNIGQRSRWYNRGNKGA